MKIKLSERWSRSSRMRNVIGVGLAATLALTSCGSDSSSEESASGSGGGWTPDKDITWIVPSCSTSPARPRMAPSNASRSEAVIFPSAAITRNKVSPTGSTRLSAARFAGGGFQVGEILLRGGGVDDFRRRAVVTQVDHFHAFRLQNPAHDVDGGIMTIEKRSCRNDPEPLWGMKHK